ncbi:hypothetical protein [Actinoplanes derwentensis]|uniref:3-oxoacyl-[acyl-carrier-protein] synthase-3 n=1 Tax=Actinoplanes derwentensis TaxID=113562 RepID=A0A1H2DDH8_9ACTN|nr:hypothetical protein [Actinoplanes derwentensis]GID89574.1 hypothetical protein Ade03nite_84980 [Actinoplanes derwentensis]SDT80552.1 3-oxoacyl-[acyl-carrier-protein] synthase-3 [Actinoplanes derwentensis]
MAVHPLPVDVECHLSAIRFAVGRPVPVEQVAGGSLAGNGETLSAEGIDFCRIDERPPAVMAAETARATLEAAPEVSVGAVVYCTDTPTGATPTMDMWTFLEGAGLVDVSATAVSGGACGNLGLGLAAARGILATQPVDAVLLVTSDAVRDGTRFNPDGLTVMSDGAASCLVTRQPFGGFRLTGLSSATQLDIDMNRGFNQARTMNRNIGQAVRQAFAGLDHRPVDCRHFVTANYGTTPRSFLAMAAGCRPAQILTPTAREVGHCFSADILINLFALLAEGDIRPNDRLCMLATSRRSWHAMAADYVPEKR